ncbi:MAG TPA: hypothetical protein VHY22_15215 [Chthoniobacteraceae bacterium]|jgi:hypothetical protein|nr:hypothetical protein [Chthoniobacteraceae bacterium]
MSIDFEEVRSIVEAAKKRGAITEAGSEHAGVLASDGLDKTSSGVVLPEWLKNGIRMPDTEDRSGPDFQE